MQVKKYFSLEGLKASLFIKCFVRVTEVTNDVKELNIRFQALQYDWNFMLPIGKNKIHYLALKQFKEKKWFSDFINAAGDLFEAYNRDQFLKSHALWIA